LIKHHLAIYYELVPRTGFWGGKMLVHWTSLRLWMKWLTFDINHTASTERVPVNTRRASTPPLMNMHTPHVWE